MRCSEACFKKMPLGAEGRMARSRARTDMGRRLRKRTQQWLRTNEMAVETSHRTDLRYILKVEMMKLGWSRYEE